MNATWITIISNTNKSPKNNKKKIVILSDVIVKPRNQSLILNKHLTLPSVSKTTTKIRSMNRIGAISSKEWRQFEKEKEEVKEQKKHDILTKRIKRFNLTWL